MWQCSKRWTWLLPVDMAPWPGLLGNKMTDLAALRVIALQKVSAPAYLHHIFTAWRERAVIVPTDDPVTLTLPNIPIAERLMVESGGGWFDESLPLDDDAAPAQISFTSGTTGTPKPILLSRRALSDVTRRLNAVMQIDESIREYIGVPVTFSFGLGRARAIAAVGGKSYLPPNGFRPDELADMLERGEINALSAVPTLLRILIQQRELIVAAGPKLKWLEIGSQYMSAEEKVAVRELFPNARIVQHYGLTEASRTTFLVISETQGAALESVGKPETGDHVRIAQDGRIAVRGANVADGVLTEEGLVPLADTSGWLTTNDLGAIDADGYVYFQGRADHLLNVSGIKVPAELFEQKLAEAMEADGGNIAVAARKDPLRGEAVLVAHLASVPAKALHEKARAIGMGFGLGAADISVVEVPFIPRTDTGKVRRGEITMLFGAEAAPARTAPLGLDDEEMLGDEEMSDREREIAAIWVDALGVPSIGRNESFFDIGGDSLSAISVMIRMERMGVPKALTQRIFEGRTIAEIAADMDAGDDAPKRAPAIRAQTVEAINITRGILVLVVIAAHWAPFFLDRLGRLSDTIGPWTNPLFRFGTPGFAMVFGLGLGYFQMPMLARNRERLNATLRLKVWVVAGGVLALGLLRGVDSYLEGELDAFWATRMFYNVLAFYLLMTMTSGIVLRLVGRGRYPPIRALQMMLISFTVGAICRAFWIDDTWWSVADLGRLMLVAKYGYPEMLGYTLIGLSIGVWIENNNNRTDLAPLAAGIGSLLFFGGILLSITTGQAARWLEHSATHISIIVYAGTIFLLFALSFVLVRRTMGVHWASKPLRLMSIVGTLSIAAYVGHEMVPTAMDILGHCGVPYHFALAIPVLMFIAGFGFTMRRLYRMYMG